MPENVLPAPDRRRVPARRFDHELLNGGRCCRDRGVHVAPRAEQTSVTGERMADASGLELKDERFDPLPVRWRE